MAETVTKLVRDVRLNQPRLGTRKLHYLLGPILAEHGIKLGRDRRFEVLRAASLLIVPRRAYHKTTHNHHRFRCHPKLLKTGPAQVVPTAFE
jgi:putative transposase